MGNAVVSNLSEDLDRGPVSRFSLGKIADLLERNNIDISEVGTIKKVSLYQSLTKNEEGEAEVHDLTAIQFSPAWAEGPQWPVVHPGPPVKLPPLKARANKETGLSTAVVLPDMQIGYFRTKDGDLEPTQDEGAISIALSIVKAINPDQVILLGDNLDLPEMSKYRHSPAFQLTTQATIDRATTLCAQLRTAAPNAKIKWLAGNHEERLMNYIIDNAKAAFGIKRGNDPDSFPVMSVPYLCRFADFDIDYVPGYPAGQLWLNERLKIIHGTKVKSNGSTAHAYLSTEKVSVIYGHIHRREWAERTRDDWDGPKTVMAASPGCLARCDGAVPSTKGGMDLDGRPVKVHEDWQQGLAVVNYETSGDHQFWYEQVPIHGGKAFYRGKIYDVVV
jgi:predicted phosphodiesterase